MARYTQNINPKSAYQLILDVEEIFADDYVSTNTTSVNVIGIVKHNGNTLYSAVWASSINTVNINGTVKNPSTAYNLKNGSSSQIFNYTVPVEHNADGSKSITISWSFTGGDTGNQYNPNGSISITFTLQTIPRATKLTAQTFTINTKGTIKWTKASSTFKHTLTYKFGSLSGTIGTAKGLVDSVDWTPPDSFYQQMAGKSGTGTLYLTTYNGDTQIGTTQEAKLTINAIESEANPQISSFSVVDNNATTIDLTGDNKKLVLTKSNAYATLKFTTRKYATAKSITINGKNVAVPTGSSSNGTTTYNVSVSLGTATSGSFNVTVIDSRGYSKNGSTSNSVINYVPLDTTANFKRIGPTTGKVGLEFSGNYFNGSFGSISNSLSISYKYKKSTDSTYTTVNLTKDTHYKISGNTYYSGIGTSRQVIILPETFDYKVQYDVQLVISDRLTTLPVVNAVISKGIPIVWWNGEKVQINGDLYVADENGENAVNVGDIIQYSPNSAGTNGQYWKSDGSGRGAWQSLSTTPTSGSTTAITSGGVYTAVNNLKPVTLFTSATGTQGSFSLSDNIKNYTKLEIVAGYREYHEVSIIYPNVDLTNQVILAFDWHDGTIAFGRFGSRYTMSGKTFTYQSSFRLYKYGSQSTSSFDTTNSVSVFRVVGYK